MEWGNPGRRRRDGRRTRRQRTLVALLVAAACVPLPAAAQQRAIGMTQMRAEILDAMTLNNGANMDFGRISPGNANGTVVMTPDDASNVASCATNNGIIQVGNCRSARFQGNVPFIFNLQITKPAGNQVILTGPAGATMRLHDFTFAKGSGLMIGPALTTDPQYWVIGGNFEVFVGGTLDVARTQRAGVYNGTITLSFNYN
jgi:hypothetical protein